ncbi:MAG: DUF2273 domain-containing protein [Bacillota bacterium]|nr:DUF2273 domain-containing protein [Bacillota bacterium]
MSIRDTGRDILENHRGKLLGSLIGLLVALLIMWVGFLWTLFVLACVLTGFWIGKRMDDSKENLVEVLDRILPPGSEQ